VDKYRNPLTAEGEWSQSIRVVLLDVR